MQKKIKIVHITSSLKMGGAEAVLCDLIKKLDPSVFEHHVIFFHDGVHSSCLRDLNISIYQVKGVVSLYDPFFCYRLYKLVKKIAPDCIHSLLWSANVFARLIGKALNIVTISAMHNNIDQDGKLRNILDSITINFAQVLIAVSPQVKQSILDKNKWLPATKIEVIENGIDLNQLRALNQAHRVAPSQLGLTENHFVIGSVGRFVPVKNYGLLLESFALLYVDYQHARLVLVGLGPLETQLKEDAQRLGIAYAVIFVVGQPSYKYYHLFDCFALASDKEGISIALLEAMSFGIACVITNSSADHAVIIHGVNGLIVQAGNAQQLAQGFEYCIDNRQIAQQMGHNAQQIVMEKFASDGMVARYELLFKKVSQKNFQ